MDLTDIHARVPSADEADLSDRDKRMNREVAAVRRRSRLIRRMRRWFPIAIVLLFLLNMGWILVTSVINSMNVYAANTNEIRMTNPRYFGQTGKGEHYVIRGLEAVRKGKDSVTVSLKSPVMEFKGDSDGATQVSAQDGVFDQEKRTFTMSGNVMMKAGASDFTFKTEEAVVDLNNSTVSGDKHVEGTSSVVHIVGESFVISDNGRSIQFRGKGDSKVTAGMK